MPQAVRIRCSPEAFAVIKAMEPEGLERRPSRPPYLGQHPLAHGLACDHECLMSWSPRARPQAPSPGAGKNPIPRPSPARGSTSTNRLPAPPSKADLAQEVTHDQRHRARLGRIRPRAPLGVFADRSSIEMILFAVFNYEIHEPGSQRLFSAGTERMALPNAGGLPPPAIADGVSGRRFSYAVTASRIQLFWL